MSAGERDYIWVQTLPGGITQAIISSVASKHDVPLKAMTAQHRNRQWARARQEAFYRVWKDRPSLSLPAIGRIFGGRDHTTILHGIRAYCERESLSYEDEKAKCGR